MEPKDRNQKPDIRHPTSEVRRPTSDIRSQTSDRWDPNTSKWKAALEIGMDVKLKGTENILYLGASSGTTVGQLSKLTTGYIFAVEKSSNMAIPLIRLAEQRNNIVPLFVDAHDIEYIKSKIKDFKIDILFQDIPSMDQVEIILANSTLVEKKCKILLSLKTLSISKAKKEDIIKLEEKKIKEYFSIIDSQSLEKYHKGHTFFILEKKK